MPRPARQRAAHFQVKVLDPAWRYSTARWRAVWTVAHKLNALQFLTIRRYLTLVFATLILSPGHVVAAWR